jgi:hypothetical protein
MSPRLRATMPDSTIHQALDVSIDHRIPGVEISILGGLETGRKACVVDEQVEFSKVRRQASDRCFDRGSIPDVKNDGMYASQSELIRKGLEPVVPASHRDNPVGVGGEASYDRRAEAGGCSCDEDVQFNLLTRGFDVCCDELVVRVPPSRYGADHLP